ncbi:MAG: hypothetical protein AB1611_22450 [bacterium]
MVQCVRLLASISTLLPLIIFIGGIALWDNPAYALLQSGKGKRERSLTGNYSSRGEDAQIISPQRLQKDESWRYFLARNGGDWKVLRSQTANYLRVEATGTSSSGKAQRKLSSQADLIEESKKFIRENESIFQVSYQDFHLERVYQRGEIWYVRFSQYAQSIPVYGGYLTLRYQQSGKLLTFGGTVYPGITIDPQSSLDSRTAIGMVAQSRGLSPDSLTCNQPRLVIYPLQDTQPVAYRLCWEIEATCPRLAKGWRYFIDAQDGSIIEYYDRARYSVFGKVEGQILPEYPGTILTVPFSNLTATLLDKTSPLMFENLNQDPGWAGTSLFRWEYGIPVAGSSGSEETDPDAGHTGSAVYGYNLRGSYYENLTNREYLTTKPITRQSGSKKTVLRFWRWLGVEGSNSDKANIEISSLPGNWHVVWSNPLEPIYDGEWKLVSYDLSSFLSGNPGTFSIRWGMGPTNSFYNYCGWNIDDIGVYHAVQGVTDENGSFTFTNEAANNILDISLKGTYFQVRNHEGEGLVYTNGNIVRNRPDEITVTLKAASDYNPQTDTGTISASGDIDELNAYYHANYLIEYLKAIDPNFPGRRDSFFPISITVHNTEEINNSYWLEGDGIYLGEGDKAEYQDFSLYSDIIYHEVSHAVTDTIYESNPVSNPSRFNQFDAMHEAFSDYWACTINNDSLIAEGGFWNQGALRDLENDLHYRLNYGDELYESSLILSGAMWNLRKELRRRYGENGIKTANTLFLFAAYAEPVSYLDFLLDILAVDEAKYDRAYRDIIKDSFGLKGIAEPPAEPSSIVVSVDRSTVKLSWERVAEAQGYNLYYDVSAIRAVQSASRYTPGGSSGDGGSMDSGTGGTGGNGGDMNGGTPGGNSGNNSGTNGSIRNLRNKVDVGNVTSYNLTNLQNNTTYRILLTAYNEYDVESSPSQDIYATPVDPNNTSKTNYIYVPTPVSSGSSDDKSKMCFIGTIGSWFGCK